MWPLSIIPTHRSIRSSGPGLHEMLSQNQTITNQAKQNRKAKISRTTAGKVYGYIKQPRPYLSGLFFQADSTYHRSISLSYAINIWIKAQIKSSLYQSHDDLMESWHVIADTVRIVFHSFPRWIFIHPGSDLTSEKVSRGWLRWILEDDVKEQI